MKKEKKFCAKFELSGGHGHSVLRQVTILPVRDPYILKVVGY